MKYEIRRDEALKTSTVTFSWTDGEVEDVILSPAEKQLMDNQIDSTKNAAMVVLIVAAGIEESSARDKRQFN